MTYASRVHLEQRFGAGEIAELAKDPDDPRADRTARVLLDAAAIMDSYLGMAYALPLPPGNWTLLREIQCDIARAELYDDSALKAPKEIAGAAIKRLEMLRDGKIALADDTGALVPRRDAPVVSAPAPVMARNTLLGP